MDRLAHAMNWKPERGEALLVEWQKKWKISPHYSYTGKAFNPAPPENMLAWRIRRRYWQAMKRAGLSERMECPLSLLGCSLPELVAFIESKFPVFMTWENYDRWHLDHIRPVVSFRMNDPEDRKVCFHHSNLQPLWAKDNLRKSSRWNGIRHRQRSILD